MEKMLLILSNAEVEQAVARIEATRKMALTQAKALALCVGGASRAGLLLC